MHREGFWIFAALCGLRGDIGNDICDGSPHKKRFRTAFLDQLARDAFFAQDYDAVINHLKYAIRKREQEDQFYFLLGLAYLQKGNEAAAWRWFAQAEEIAATDAQKRNYSNKIDMLLSTTD